MRGSENHEVLIIGGGLIGLSLARELRNREVKSVTVVERGTLGSEASWAAAGMLAPNIETDTHEDFHRLGIESLEMYPKLAGELKDETGIDIELDRSGTIRLAFNETEEADLEVVFRHQEARGVQVEMLSRDRVRELEPEVSESAVAGLFYPNDWQVDNRKLLAALRRFAKISGVRIVENVEVCEASEKIAKTPAGNFEADKIVLATGAWTSLIKIGDTRLPIEVKPIRGQMISFEVSPRLLRHVVYSSGGYLVPRADGRILVGATVEDVGFEKAMTDRGVDSLVQAAEEILPSLSALTVADSWSGLRPFATDGLPIIGAVPGYDNIFVATAHYRNGILLAPLTAKILADELVDNVSSPFLESFYVGRFDNATKVRAF